MKPNDRVRVYATLNGTRAETKGTVTRIRADEMLYVNLDGRRGEIVAHPKQCRRLVKKERRRIYITHEEVIHIERGCDLGDSVETRAYRYPHKNQLPDLVEFIEVKRKDTP